MNLRCDQCPVKDSAACAVLSPEERETLARSGRTRKLRRGEILFYAGERSDACATLTSGMLKVTSVDEDGTEHILSLVHPAGFTGELFAPFERYDVVALTDSELCIFAQSDMNQALERYPALSKALLRRTQEELFASRSIAALSSRRTAKSRVAGLIEALARAASDSPCHPAAQFDLPMTRGEMAQLLGLTIETVSRQMTELEKDAVISRTKKRGIELIDPAQLRQLAA